MFLLKTLKIFIIIALSALKKRTDNHYTHLKSWWFLRRDRLNIHNSKFMNVYYSKYKRENWYLLVGVRGVLGTSNSVWWLFLSTTGSSTTFILLFCIISCNMLNNSSARAHLKAKIPINIKEKGKMVAVALNKIQEHLSKNRTVK